MTIYDLKPAFQKLLRPTVKLLINLGLTPNTVTIITCFLSLVMATILYLNPRNSIILLTIPIFMFCRMALNAIDGMMAKEHGMITPLGTLLNEFTDVLADSALYLAFCSQVLISEKLIVAITLLAVLTVVVKKN